MSKKEFLRRLEEAMLEQMDISEVASHIRYYNDFIENEVKNGRDEDEVVSSLQSPRLIAKNIIENSNSANKYKSDINGEESYKKSGRTSPVSFSINGKPINSLAIKLVLITIVLVVLLLVIAVIGGVLFIISRLVLPVMVIGGIIYLLVNVVRKIK